MRDIRLTTDKLVFALLPGWARATFRLAWLRGVCAELQRMFDEFLAWRSEKNREANVTGETISLEAWLNHVFNLEPYGIFVLNKPASGIVLFRESEGEEQTELFLESESTANDKGLLMTKYEGEVVAGFATDFRVTVPDWFTDSMIDRVEVIVRKYKKSCKTFEIIRV